MIESTSEAAVSQGLAMQIKAAATREKREGQ
jgi:hypothetical protein